MERDSSHGVILRSTGILAASTALGIVVGLVRTKVLAALLGPAGVGVAGVLTSIMSAASTLSGAGLSGSGVRQLAASAGDADTLARVRRALLTATLALGGLGGVAVWLARGPIAQAAFGDAARSADIGWLSVGVFLSVVAGSQTALLQGLRRIGDMARATVAGAALGAAAGVAAIWLAGDRGIVAFVLTAPAMSVLCASYYARRTGATSATPAGFAGLVREWRALLALGAAFMFVALIGNLAQVWIRAVIVRDLGLEPAGHFQAAWTISSQYVGFVLGAMTADYYPRLTHATKDPARMNRLVNEQVEMGLLLAGPAILAMIGIAPLVVRILYSPEFSDTVEILRWQMAGDLFKIASWPIGFVLVARGARLAFLGTQSLWVILYLGMVLAGLSAWGLEITGFAFLICFAVGLAVNCLVVGKMSRFRLTGRNIRTLAVLLVAAAAIGACAWSSDWLAALAGLVLAALACLYSLRELLRLLEPDSKPHRWLCALPAFMRGVPGQTRRDRP